MSPSGAETDSIDERIAELQRELDRLRGLARPRAPAPAGHVLQVDLTPDVEAILEQMPVAVHVVDVGGATVFRNAARKAIWGGDEPLDGFGSWDFAAWDDATGKPLTREDWPIARALATGEPQPPITVRLSRFDGGQGYMSVFATPLVDRDGRIVAAMSVAQDITARRHAEASHRFTRELLHRMGETTTNFIYAKDRDSRMVYANTALLRAVGKTWDQIKGRTDIEWHDDPEEGRRYMEADARVIAVQRTEAFEEPMTLPSGTVTFLSTKSPLFDEHGALIGMFGISADISPQKEMEAQRRLLTEELKHRVKNTLTLVQSMARHTLRSAGVGAEAWNEFEARLMAMARSHDTLTSESWADADLRAVLTQALDVHATKREGRFDLTGEPVRIDASLALSLAMATHELGTNAVKYGALSAPGGRVDIAWTLHHDPEGQVLELVWRETGGPPVRPPVRRGFGSRLIERILDGAGDQRSRIDFLPDGVRCRLFARLKR